MPRSVEVARAFVSISAETQGLQQGLTLAEKQLGRLAKFIQDHPIAALGSLGTAFLGVSWKATQMAAEVDAGVRALTASVPDVIGRFDLVKDSVRGLSVEYGLSQTAVLSLMKTVGEGGVESADALVQMTKAVLLTNRALGQGEEGFAGVAQGLDKILDGFNENAANSEKILAKLFVTAQGKTSLSEMFTVFERLSPLAEKSGLSFDVMAAAVATLIGRGRTAKQVVSELGETFAKEGSAGLEALAAKSTVASNGLKELEAAAARNSETLPEMNRRLKAELNASLIDFGSVTLPLATKAVHAFTQAISDLTGHTDRVVAAAAVEQMEELAKAAKDSKRGLLELTAGLSLVFTGGESALVPVGEMIRKLQLYPNLAQVTTDKLQAMVRGFTGLAESGRLTAPELEKVRGVLELLNKAIAERPPAGGGAAAAIDQLTAAEIRAIKASKDLTEEQRNALLSAKVFSEAQKEQVARAVKAATEAARQQLEKANKIFADIQELGQKAQRDLLTGHQKEMADLTAEFEKKITELEKTEGSKRVAQARGILDQAKRDLVQHWAGIDQDVVPKITHVQTSTLELKDSTEDLDDAIAKLRERTVGGTQADIDAAKRKAELKQRVDDLIDPIERASQSTADWADKILATADALGISDDRMRDAVRNIQIIDQAIGDLHDSLSALSGASSIGQGLTGILGAISAGATVIEAVGGVLNSLFGDSPETRARKELLRRNTKALEDLTEAEIDRLRAGLPGATFAGLQDALRSFLARPVVHGPGAPQENQRRLLQDLTAAGVSVSDLEEAARFLNLELRNAATGRIDTAALRLLLKELSGIDFTQIGDSFEAQLRHLEDLIEVGVVDPAEKFGGILDILSKTGSAAPGITKALTGIDVSTEAGREAAAAALRALIAGFDDLTEGDFGQLMQGQFTDVIKQLLGLLASGQSIGTGLGTPQVQPPAGAAPTGEPTDPVTVEPIPDPLFPPSTEAAFWEEALGLEREERDLLQGILDSLPTPATGAPPPLPAGLFAAPTTTTGPGGNTVNVQAGAIVLTINAPGGDPAAVQAAAEAGLVEAFDALMEGRRLAEKQNIGSASRN